MCKILNIENHNKEEPKDCFNIHFNSYSSTEIELMLCNVFDLSGISSQCESKSERRKPVLASVLKWLFEQGSISPTLLRKIY